MVIDEHHHLKGLVQKSRYGKVKNAYYDLSIVQILPKYKICGISRWQRFLIT